MATEPRPSASDLTKEPTTVAATSTPTKTETPESTEPESTEPEFFIIGSSVAPDTTLTIDQAQAKLDEARSRYFAGTGSAEDFEQAKADVVSARQARRRR